MSFVIKNKRTQQQLLAKTTKNKKFNAAQTVVAAVLSSPAKANDLNPKLVIEQVLIDQLKAAKRRVRKPGKNHLANVIKCLQIVGPVAPVLIDGDNHIVDGHVVVDALKALDATHVNVVRLDHLNDDQLKIVRIALNRLAEGSVWELEELRIDLQHLDQVGYDLTGTGFSLPELDIILQEPNCSDAQAEAEENLEPPTTPVSRLGDLWCLEKHRLLCGNSVEQESYVAVLGTRKADACFTDCPWNLAGKTISSQHGDFKMGSGEMTDEAFQAFCDTFTHLIAEHLKDGAVLYSCIDWRSCGRIEEAGRKAGLKHINTVVWNKGSGSMGGLYRSQHEFVPVFLKGTKTKTNNVELGKHGRDRTNVWSYPGANKPGSSAAKALKDHPTPKPVEMVADALLDVTKPGELVIDPFVGSGTSLLAAQRTGRIAAGIDLDPAYLDVCIRRWEEMTGKHAVHASTGKTFAEVAALRDIELQGETDDAE